MGVKHKMGIIGFGWMGCAHFTMLTNSNYDRVEVKGVFDIAQSGCDAAVERGIIAYESREALLSDPEIDLVLIATTNEAHKPLLIEAMRAGKHVISEKPVTLSSEDLMDVMSVSKETGKVFTINQNRRTNCDFVLMRRNVENEYIGKPLVIESRVEGSRGIPSKWRTLKAHGGGMMFDWGVHLIDQLMYMIPERVTEVYCKMLSVQYDEVEDNFHLLITFESGLIAIIEVGTNHYITHPRWYVMGKYGTLQIDDWECNGRIVRCKYDENEQKEDIVMTAAGPTRTMAPLSEKSIEKIELIKPENIKDDIIVVYDQFIDAVEGKAELTIKPEQALRVMRVIDAAFESDKTKKAISVNI